MHARRLVLVPMVLAVIGSLCPGPRHAPAQSAADQRFRTATSPSEQAASRGDSTESEHPLTPVLDLCRSCLDALEDVDDYEATFSKWDIVDGRGYGHTMSMKFRSEPMSVYFRFTEPHAGREVIYVEGRNGGNLLAHETGLAAIVGTVALPPDSPRALSESKWPITRAGMKNMVTALLERWELESKFDGCQVLYYPNARLKGMECRAVEVTHPHPRRELPYHITRLYIEQRTGLPVRLEAFGYPTRAGQKPPLLEQYTYWNLRTNVGLRDADFDAHNPSYGF